MSFHEIRGKKTYLLTLTVFSASLQYHAFNTSRPVGPNWEAPMFKINKKTEYALIALRYMSEKSANDLSTAKEINAKFATPFDATARVLQVLASRGWLRSEQGAHGGYRLCRDLRELSLLELCEMIEGPQALVRCLAHGSQAVCDLEASCNVRSPLNQINQKFLQFMRELKVSELLQQNPAHSSARAEGIDFVG